MPEQTPIPEHSGQPVLSPLGETVRRADPDRFFTALFAPAERREALFTLYAFNHETARARETTREPIMALIRLQWWREVVQGVRKRHEVATPLAALLEAGALDPAELEAVIDARELTEFATLAEWRAWLLQGAGSLALAAGRVLGVPDGAGLRGKGAAYGAAGVLRNVPAMTRAGICQLPADLLAAHDLTVDDVIAAPLSPRLRPVFAALAEEGRGLLGGRSRPGRAIAAALPGVLARRDLRHPGRALPRGLGDRLAVTASALTGWV